MWWVSRRCGGLKECVLVYSVRMCVGLVRRCGSLVTSRMCGGLAVRVPASRPPVPGSNFGQSVRSEGR